MKKILALSVILLLLLAFSGCTASSLAIKNADDVTIFYGVSSYAMFGADENTMKSLSGCFEDLRFEPTEEPMDFATMLSVTFFKDEEQIAQVSVDANDVFQLNGNAERYKLASGTFSYKTVKDIYEQSK